MGEQPSEIRTNDTTDEDMTDEQGVEMA